jgi:hypothetical protein
MSTKKLGFRDQLSEQIVESSAPQVKPITQSPAHDDEATKTRARAQTSGGKTHLDAAYRDLLSEQIVESSAPQVKPITQSPAHDDDATKTRARAPTSGKTHLDHAPFRDLLLKDD